MKEELTDRDIEIHRKMIEKRREEAIKIVDEKFPHLKFLRRCPYFQYYCKSYSWDLKGPCGVCLKNSEYKPSNAEDANNIITEEFVKRMKSQAR